MTGARTLKENKNKSFRNSIKEIQDVPEINVKLETRDLAN